MAQEQVTPVIPQLYVESVEKARDFYIEKLGFGHMMGVVGKDGKFDFAIVKRDAAMVMFARPDTKVEGSGEKYPTKRPVELYIYVPDVDAYHESMRERQVRVVEPLKTQWWGDRNFAVEDAYGYRVWFLQTVEEWGKIIPPPGVKVV